MLKRILVVTLLLGVFGAGSAFAETQDTGETRVKDAASDAKANVKKGARTASRKMRKATGNDNVINDAKDKVNDTKDDLKNAEEKSENHK